MTILDKSLMATVLTMEEAVYLQVLDEKGNDDCDMEYKLAVMFGLDEETAGFKVEAYRKFQRGEVL